VSDLPEPPDGARRKSGLARTLGVHIGAVVAGNPGSQTRMKYSVLGDTVNVASHPEALNENLG
jgi:class 3 adenylate cyclase